MSTKIGVERIQSLQRDGLFFETTKLLGLEEIGYILGWSESKLKIKMQELKDAGVIFQDRIGSPPIKMWCSYTALILRYVSLKGQKNEVL